MASANPNFSEIITTTLKNRQGVIADNISNNNALLARLRRNGNTMLEDGGQTLVQELDFAENSTFKYYSGYDTIDVSGSNVISAAEYDWKQAAAAVTISGLEMAQNSGSETRVLNLMQSRIQNAERTVMNQIAAGIFSDGTGSSGKEIGGLQLLVADTPTSGTVGGINRANFEFWRNVSFDATSDGGAAATSANIQDYMNTVWRQLIRPGDAPDLIVADGNYFNFFWESLQSIQRITSAEQGTSGFRSLAFNGPGGTAEVVLDGNAPTNHMYFLNSNYLFWKVHRDRNFAPTPDIRPTNQDAVAQLILFMGNMTLSNAKLQGVLKD